MAAIMRTSLMIFALLAPLATTAQSLPAAEPRTAAPDMPEAAPSSFGLKLSGPLTADEFNPTPPAPLQFGPPLPVEEKAGGETPFLAGPENAEADESDTPSGSPDRHAGHPAGASPELHGEVRFAFQPRSLDGSRNNLTRPGLGGITNAEGAVRLGAFVRLEGRLLRERLSFAVSYAPEWERDHYRYRVDAADLARDGISGAGTEVAFDQGLRRDARYRARLAWHFTASRVLTLTLDGAPGTDRGSLRPLGLRIDAGQDPGVTVVPGGYGVLPLDAARGVNGRRRGQEQGVQLRYAGDLLPALSLEIEAGRRRSGLTETPALAADVTNYLDVRRAELYSRQVVNGFLPATAPTRYQFGGLGPFDGGSREQVLAAAVRLTGHWQAAGSHETRISWEFADRRYRENPLSSGPREDQGPLIYLREFFGFPIPSSFIRVRSGAAAEINCAGDTNLPASDFASACPTPVYSLVRGILSPPPPDAVQREWSADAGDVWRVGRLTLDAGLRATSSRLSSAGDYELRSEETGEILTGGNGNELGSRIPDVSEYGPPHYVAGPGKFVGGGYRFPVEFTPRAGVSWDMLGEGRLMLSARYARVLDAIPEEVALHAFTSEFGLVRAGYGHPDLSVQTIPGTTYGDVAPQVQPETRRGYQDRVQLGLDWRAHTGVIVSLYARASRQRRILAITQANSIEAIANFFNDITVQSGGCLNCARRQTSLFPDYPIGTGPEAHGFLSPTLANPGVNTAAGRFGNPRRNDETVELLVSRPAAEGGHFSWGFNGLLARSRGNYDGLIMQENGTGPAEPATLFDYPLSPLTRSKYASGPLDPVAPSQLRIKLVYDDLFIKNLAAALTLRCQEGPLRTPQIASPFSGYPGLLPGIRPDYYRFNLNFTGNTDAVVLRDYLPVERGALGRAPALTTLDLALGYRWHIGRGNLETAIRVFNLLDATRIARYDDTVELAKGNYNPFTGMASGDRPAHNPAASDPTLRVPNPAYGLPTQVQSPRSVEMSLGWSF
jgi:hypothetical protein